MSEKSGNATGNVVSMPRPKGSLKGSEALWGKPVMKHGFTITPNLLLKAQARLDLQPRHVGVLLQLMSFYWEKGRPPFPTKRHLAELCNVSPKTIQRVLKDLEDRKLVERVERHHAGHNGKLSNIYKLDGLEQRLKALEPEFTAIKEEKKKLDKDVRSKGHTVRRKVAAQQARA